MKERRKIILIAIAIMVLITLIGVQKIFLNKKEEILPEVKLKEVEKNKAFAIMVPDINGNGYIPYDKNEWPTDAEDYYYVKSECIDNNGKVVENAISYNEENNTASLTTNSTVYCTLYFDKYPYMKASLHSVSCGEGCTNSTPDYMSTKVKKVEFVDHIKDDLNPSDKNIKWWDLSDTSQGTPAGSVIAWIEPIQDDISHDILYIGSQNKKRIKAIYLTWTFPTAEYENDMHATITSLESINFNNMLDTSKTINMGHMFSGCKNLTKIDGMENWDVTKVENMDGMFFGTSLTNLNFLGNWQTSSLKSIANIFANCSKLNDINGIANWNTLHITNMYCVFNQCSNLQNIDAIQNWKITNVNMLEGFLSGSNISNVDALKSWDVSNVTTMKHLFHTCSNLSDVSGIINWQTPSLENIQAMFCDCTNLQTINLSSWKTENLKNVSYMFSGCTKLATIDMSSATFTQIKDSNNYADMFSGVPTSAKITVKTVQKDWITSAGFKGTITEV